MLIFFYLTILSSTLQRHSILLYLSLQAANLPIPSSAYLQRLGHCPRPPQYTNGHPAAGSAPFHSATGNTGRPPCTNWARGTEMTSSRGRPVVVPVTGLAPYGEWIGTCGALNPHRSEQGVFIACCQAIKRFIESDLTYGPRLWCAACRKDTAWSGGKAWEKRAFDKLAYMPVTTSPRRAFYAETQFSGTSKTLFATTLSTAVADKLPKVRLNFKLNNRLHTSSARATTRYRSDHASASTSQYMECWSRAKVVGSSPRCTIEMI